MSRILIIGGYGGFGGRVARRLAAAGHEILVAGRSFERARAFCTGIPGLSPLALDRTELARALAESRPDIVVDASGPFQAMDYAAPLACIAAGVHYCDLADAREFVVGISALDAQAQRAGVVALSGASSVPALSGAVARELGAGLSRVRAVEMAISASNQAAAGPAVAAAILGQVGRKMRLFRAGRWVERFGWQELRRQDFFVSGAAPIVGRLVALADTPDLLLLSRRLPGHPAVSFRAGTELAFQNLALWLASWSVRWGWIGDFSRGARWLRPLQGLTAALGGDRSAMIVRLFGDRAGERIERRWTLIAERGDGPEIPALAAPLVIARILAGQEAPGARDAGLALTLADFDAAFAGLAIWRAIEEITAPAPLYARIMGPAFDALPTALRAMHDVWREGGASGEAEVTGAAHAFGRLIARAMGFPRTGRRRLHVAFAERDGVETWTRDFDGHRFVSNLSERDGQLVERFGPLRFRFELRGDGAGLAMIMRGWSAFGVALPLVLAPRSAAREWEQDGRFHFDVPIALPVIGRLVHYRGWLEPLL